MTTFIKRLTMRGWMVLAFVAFFLYNGTMVLGQDGAEIPAFPSVSLFIALAAGILLHWAKGFVRGTNGANLWDYLSTSVWQTITTIAASVGQLQTMWSNSNSVLNPTTFTAIWIVFLMGFGSDSLFNGTSGFIKPSTAG